MALTPGIGITSILDRMHAIHGTISVDGITLRPQRYNWQDAIKQPGVSVITPMLVATTNYAKLDSRRFTVTRVFGIRVWSAGWGEGIPGETAMRTTELLAPAIEAAYLVRPRLELEDSGIIGIHETQLSNSTIFGADLLQADMLYRLTVITTEKR